MPNIFRRIRQEFLSQHRLGRYLLYAIGEIILVVIGILLALQINTWNEQRNLKQREVKFLKELRSNLDRNTEVFRKFEELQGGLINNMNRLVELRQSSLPFNDSLAPYFVGITWLEQINLVTSAYETMKTGGLDIISSDSLRLRIIDLHEVFYAQYKEVVKDGGLALFSTQVQNFVREYPELSDRYKSSDFIHFLKARLVWKNDIRNDAILYLNQTLSLIGEIDRELERLSK